MATVGIDDNYVFELTEQMDRWWLKIITNSHRESLRLTPAKRFQNTTKPKVGKRE
jgi:hypothetical protein